MRTDIDRFWAGVGLAAVLLQAALLWIEWRPTPRPLWGDEATYWRAAGEVRAGGESDLQMIWPPLYPRFVAASMPLSGGSRLAAQLVQVALLFASAWLLRGLGRALLPGAELSRGIHAADVAAALLLLDPQVACFGAFLWPELLHLALFLFAWWALVTRGERWPWLVAAGVALGLALLAKSLLVAFVPVLLAPLLLLSGPSPRRLLRPAVVLAAMAVTLLPVVLHNRQRYGVAGVADSSTFNAWVGLNERSRRNFVDEIVGDELTVYLNSAPDPAGRAAIARGKIEALVAERGVLPLLRAQLSRQYFRLFDRDSFLADQLPGGAIAERGDGYGYVAPPHWLAAALRGWGWTIYGVVLVGAALGVATVPAGNRRWLVVALLFVAYNLALFLVLHVKTRYRVQLMPVLDLFAGATAVWLVTRRPRRPALVWAAGGALAALALFLAFGGR
ncbi:MAG TPA: glycosyltransferase family 39 protein [Thermoanaerobaculia bacterium]|nr:glycosyltransferase family 39 protein [Thermoanaerobaculia bacterium]HXT50182.1 glycosyltransferase family 39 protein [Thermoanaerobaculia bacterium]